jgi:hypothetical protein
VTHQRSLRFGGACLAPAVAMCAIATLCIAPQALSFQSRPEGPGRSPDFVCGPRCALYLLRYYQVDENADLHSVIRETQWPQLEAGTSLEVLDRYLRARGIHTAAIRIAPCARLSWPHPVLLHLQGKNEQLGHFVVWLPNSTDGHTEIWAGLSQVHTGSWSDLSANLSGVVLLTSSTPIHDPSAAIDIDFSSLALENIPVALVGTGLVGIACLALWQRHARRIPGVVDPINWTT